MPVNLPTITALKAEARTYRTACDDRSVSHAQALEHIATLYGMRDWNTLSAMAPDAPRWARMDERVTGQYLGQPFSGKIAACSPMSGKSDYAVTIAFDRPVDVVTFGSFSNMRRRVSSVVNEQGCSAEVTSDGVPQMVINPLI